jgi:hypothetical protein
VNEINLAVDAPADAAAQVIGDRGSESAGAPGVRDAMLSGRFAGSGDTALADAVSGFLGAAAGDAIELWFGAERGTRLRIDEQALRDAIDRDLAAIDAMLSEQVDAILHHARLRKLEGSWRGLAWLVDGAELSNRLKIKVLNIGWPEVCRDLERAIEFDQSLLFRKVYEEEFGMPGGEPYGLLVADHELRHRPGPGSQSGTSPGSQSGAGAGSRTDDISALASLAGVAAAAFSPVVIGASPALLEVDGFADLATSIDLAAPLRNAEHARWRSLSSRPDMRFVGVALPRLLARKPWEDDGTRDDGFRYAEYAPTGEERVWMSAGYAFASVVARAFARYGWPADVRGVQVTPLAGSSADSYVIANRLEDQSKAKSGPHASQIIALAAEGRLRGSAAATFRMVVAGDADFASNSFFPYLANSDAVLAELAWLTREERAPAMKPPVEVLPTVSLTGEQMRGIFFITVLLMPGLIALAGSAMWWWRR